MTQLEYSQRVDLLFDIKLEEPELQEMILISLKNEREETINESNRTVGQQV